MALRDGSRVGPSEQARVRCSLLLALLYPALGAGQLVGADLCQAVALTVAAAPGALAFGTSNSASPRR